MCVALESRAADRSAAAPPATLLRTAFALAEAMGGHLTWQQTDSGLRVSLSLPAASPATVLVIDDNEGLVDLFERYLADSDCRVVGVQNPAAGLRLAREQRPDVIVLDILMPETDGWELLTQLRSHPATAAVPIVVCSVFNDPALARALGASAFLPKPVTQKELLSTLASLRST